MDYIVFIREAMHVSVIMAIIQLDSSISKRVVGKGCSLSPYLLILCVEVPAFKVISNINIKVLC